MASYLIEGGRRLSGEVIVSGSKNATLGVVAATVLLDGPCQIENVPQVQDVLVLIDIIRDLGIDIYFDEDGVLHVNSDSIKTCEVNNERARDIRASYYLYGALLGRFQEAISYMPGGCDFGTRPIDLHLKGFNALGADYEIRHAKIHLKAEHGLQGANIFFDQVSVGATINLMLAAVKAPGRTVIENAAREPHIVEVANFLNLMGGRIRGAGTDVIRIDGVEKLPANLSYSIIPDQIEAGTFMIAAALTHGDITVRNLIPKHMEPLSAKLLEMGAEIEVGEDYLRVSLEEGKTLTAANFKTAPYPGFPTDLQPQTVVLLTQAHGVGRMHEAVWPNRFQYIDELKRMSSQIEVMDKIALVQGPTDLTGSLVKARDLRAGAALVLAGLVASYQTEVYDIHVIERGYEDFIEKFQSLGASIRRSSKILTQAVREL